MRGVRRRLPQERGSCCRQCALLRADRRRQSLRAARLPPCDARKAKRTHRARRMPAIQLLIVASHNARSWKQCSRYVGRSRKRTRGTPRQFAVIPRGRHDQLQQGAKPALISCLPCTPTHQQHLQRRTRLRLPESTPSLPHPSLHRRTQSLPAACPAGWLSRWHPKSRSQREPPTASPGWFRTPYGCWIGTGATYFKGDRGEGTEYWYHSHLHPMWLKRDAWWGTGT